MTTAFTVLILVAAMCWHGSPTTIPVTAYAEMLNGAVAGTITGHPLHLWLAHLIGATTPDRYVYYCLALVGVAMGAVWGLARNRWGSEAGNVAFGLFLASPIAYILWNSIGLEDGLTVLFTAALLLGRHPALLAVAGFLGAVNHPACVIAGVAVLWLRYLDGEELGWWGWIGISTGVALSAVFLVHYAGRWDFFAKLNGKMLLHHHFVFWPLLVYSFGFGLWLPAVAAAKHWWYDKPWYATVAGVYFLGCAVLTVGMLDPTRVFALLSWPVVLHGLMGRLQAPSPVPPQPNILIFARWGWLAPALAIWSGELRSVTWEAWLSWVRL